MFVRIMPQRRDRGWCTLGPALRLQGEDREEESPFRVRRNGRFFHHRIPSRLSAISVAKNHMMNAKATFTNEGLAFTVT